MPLVPLSQVEDALTSMQGGKTDSVPIPTEEAVDTQPSSIPLSEANAFHQIPVTTDDAPKSFWASHLANFEIGLAQAKHMVGSAMVFMGNTVLEKAVPYLSKELNVPVDLGPDAQEIYGQAAYPVQMGNGLGQALVRTGYAWQNQVDQFVAQKTKETEGSKVPEYLQGLEQFSGSLASLIGVSLLTGPGAALTAMSAGMGAETYQKARLKGKDYDDAAKIGAAVSIVSGTPAFIGLGHVLKLSGPLIERIVKTAVIQGVDMAVMTAGTETVERVSGISDSTAQGFTENAKEVIFKAVRDGSMAAILAPATGMTFAMQKRAEVQTELKKAGMKDEQAAKLTDAMMAKSQEQIIRTVETERRLINKGIQRNENGFVDIEGRPVTPERALAEVNFEKTSALPEVERARLAALDALPQKETIGVTQTEKTFTEGSPVKMTEDLPSDMVRRLFNKMVSIEEKFQKPEAITKQRVKALQSEFDSLVRNSPLEAADKAKFLASIKNVQTFQQLRRILPEARQKIGQLAEAENVRAEISRFNKVTSSENIKRAREPYQETIRSLIKDLTPTKLSTRKGMYLEQLAKHTQEYPDQILPKERLEELASLDKKSLRDMTSEEIGLINDAIEQLYKLSDSEKYLVEKGRVFKKDIIISRAEKDILAAAKPTKVSSEIATGEETRKGFLDATAKWQSITTVKPETNFMTVEGKDGGALQRFVFGNMDRALTDKLRFVNEGRKFLRDGLKGIDVTKWSQYISRDYKKLDLIKTTVGGEQIKLSKSQALWIYLMGQNENSARHLFEGGFSVPGKPEKVYRVTTEDYERIQDMVANDKEMSQVVSTFHSFFDGFIKGALNRVSYEISGVHVAKEKNYIKIETNPLYTPKPSTREFYTGQISLEGMGFLKARTKSKLPVMMEDVFGLMQEALDHTSSYIAYAEPFRTAKGILVDPRIRQALAKAGRADYIDSFDKYIRRVEGQITTVSDIERGLQHLLTNAQGAILMVNPKILLKQPVSVFAALTEIDAKYLMPHLGKSLTATELKDLEIYSPQLFSRWNGHISRELSELKNEGRIRELFTGKVPMSDKFMGMYQAADHPMVTAVWRAATAEITEKFPGLKGAELKQKIAERAELIVRRTQAAVYTEHRSEAHADRSIGGRTLTLFSSETNTQQDMLVRSWREFLRGPKDAKAQTELAKKVLIVSYLNSFLIANINAIANIFTQSKDEGRRDESKQDWELIGKRWISDLVLGPAGAFYVGRDIASMIQTVFLGYEPREITNPAFQMLSSAYKGAADIVKSAGEAMSGEKYKTSNRKEHIRKNVTLKWKNTFARGITELGGSLALSAKLPVPTIQQWGPVFLSWVGKFFKSGD